MCGKEAAVADYVDGAHESCEIAEIFARKFGSVNGAALSVMHPAVIFLRPQRQLMTSSRPVM